MKSRTTVWPAIYILLGIAAAIGARTVADDRSLPHVDPGVEILSVTIVMPLMAAFLGIWAYHKLVLRCTPAHLAARIWHSPPTNPQSNQLAQIVGFGCLGLSATLGRTGGGLRVFGFFAMWISLGLAVSLIVFRARHVARSE